MLYQSRQKRFVRLTILAVWFLVAVPPAWAMDQCAVCGVMLGSEFYLGTDRVTAEKRPVCQSCIRLTSACFLCGLPVKVPREGNRALPDGRFLCARDAKAAVLEEAEGLRLCEEVHRSLDRLFSRFLALPDTNVTLAVVDRVHLQELFKFAGNDYSCPNVWGYTQSGPKRGQVQHTISVLSGLPQTWFQATCAHEFGHAWVAENVGERRRARLTREAEEGFCELVAYLFANAAHDEDFKARLESNQYTRGQFQLFRDAEGRFGFNDVLDWMQSGTDGRLSSEDPGRVRKLEPATPPATPHAVQAYRMPIYRAAPTVAPDHLVLKAVFWDVRRPTAIINNQTFGLREEGKVQVGTNTIVLRCLAIQPDAVRVERTGTGQQEELHLTR